MRVHSVGIIGYGAFGAFIRLLLERFAPEMEVRVYSKRYAPDGKTFFSLADACACDAVVFAVPIPVFEEVLRECLPLIPATSILVDVATVKVHTVNILKKYAGGRSYLATHPMFGPESYAKTEGDVSGFRIVITEHTLPPAAYDTVRRTLSGCGFTVVETSSDTHDRQLAETLFLTHFIGQVISRAGFERTEIDTVSFNFLMKAVESVRHDTKLFQDVFRFNPYCEAILTRLEKAERETHALLREAV
jgi:prephenate dehydrogenase